MVRTEETNTRSKTFTSWIPCYCPHLFMKLSHYPIPNRSGFIFSICKLNSRWRGDKITSKFSLDSIHQTDILLSQDISLFLYEISWWNVHKSQSFFNFKGKKQFRIEWVGFELRASDLECITLTPTPPRIWWQIPVWFKYITLTLTQTQTLTLTLLCVRIINVSTSVWRMELSVGPSSLGIV